MISDEKEIKGKGKGKKLLSKTKTLPAVVSSNTCTSGKSDVFDKEINALTTSLGDTKLNSHDNVTNSVLPGAVAPNPPMFVGKYHYVSRTNNDLGFKKGDILSILNTDDEEWWLARNESNEEGYIPSNHIAVYGSMNAEE